MRKPTGYSVTSQGTGPQFREAMNTAPAAPAPRGIAGYGPMKTSGGERTASGPGTPCPKITVTAKGYKAPKDSPKAKRMRGGDSKSGPGWTQGGTSSPKKGAGPGGMGRTGVGAPWGGG